MIGAAAPPPHAYALPPADVQRGGEKARIGFALLQSVVPEQRDGNEFLIDLAHPPTKSTVIKAAFAGLPGYINLATGTAEDAPNAFKPDYMLAPALEGHRSNGTLTQYIIFSIEKSIKEFLLSAALPARFIQFNFKCQSQIARTRLVHAPDARKMDDKEAKKNRGNLILNGADLRSDDAIYLDFAEFVTRIGIPIVMNAASYINSRGSRAFYFVIERNKINWSELAKNFPRLFNLPDGQVVVMCDDFLETEGFKKCCGLPFDTRCYCLSKEAKRKETEREQTSHTHKRIAAANRTAKAAAASSSLADLYPEPTD